MRRCFSVNFAKFLRTPVLQNTSGRLLLDFFIRFPGFFFFCKPINFQGFLFFNMFYHGFQTWWISWTLHLENFLGETNDPAGSGREHAEQHVELSGIFYRLINWSTLTFFFWISVLHCPVILYLKETRNSFKKWPLNLW